MRLLPSRRVLCTPYNHTSCHFMSSHIRKEYAYLAETGHLHFWQNDWNLLRATAVTRGWNGHRNKSQHKTLTLEKKILPPLLQGFDRTTFNHESGALTTELHRLPLGLQKVLHIVRSCFPDERTELANMLCNTEL